ncbi:NAD(P)-dependent oxidoreductase [Weissella confusa]|nr:NAD(P)-dependent oxidoreductase [Weissella confusa]MBU5286508.1 NAD(P)-dependent oxidoreductase [Weissella confusa]
MTINQVLNDSMNQIMNLTALRNKRILITGASGIIGSAVAEMLMHINQQYELGIKLTLTSRNVNKLRNRFPEKPLNQVTFLETDILDISLNSVDYVVHAAAESTPDRYVSHPVETFKSIVDGTAHLLDEAFRADIRKFIYVSSGEVYGQVFGEGLIKESDVGFSNHLEVRSSYPTAKRAAENLVMDYASQYKLDVNIVRPSHVFGPHFTGTDQRVSAYFFRRASVGKNIELTSSGNNERTYVYETDVASAVLTVMLNAQTGEVFNVTNSKNVTTIAGFAKRIAEIADVQMSFVPANKSEKLQQSQMSKALLDNSKLLSLGWKPVVNLELGITTTLGILENGKDETNN